jgi:hypothetical protein
VRARPRELRLQVASCRLQAWGRGGQEAEAEAGRDERGGQRQKIKAEDQGTAERASEWHTQQAASSKPGGRGGWQAAPEAVPQRSRRRQTGSVRGATMAPVDEGEARE